MRSPPPLPAYLNGESCDTFAYRLGLEVVKHALARIDTRHSLAETVAQGHGKTASAAPEVKRWAVEGRSPPRLPRGDSPARTGVEKKEGEGSSPDCNKYLD